MSGKIKLNSTSGGGSVSIQAPSSSSNNRVITLPDITDGTLLTDQSSLNSSKLTGALPAISGANLTGISAGITMADQWRLTSGLSVPSSDTVLSANWERVDGTAQGTLGTGMTQSSGVFTFPQTGIYLVRFQGYFEENTSTSQAQVEMRATTDGSSYSSIAFSVCSISNISTYTYNNIQMESLIDVTNVSNVKVFWKAYSATATVLDGSSTQNRTYATFLRLGDT